MSSAHTHNVTQKVPISIYGEKGVTHISDDYDAISFVHLLWAGGIKMGQNRSHYRHHYINAQMANFNDTLTCSIVAMENSNQWEVKAPLIEASTERRSSRVSQVNKGHHDPGFLCVTCLMGLCGTWQSSSWREDSLLRPLLTNLRVPLNEACCSPGPTFQLMGRRSEAQSSCSCEHHQC